MRKTYVAVYTRAVSRAVHLGTVPELTASRGLYPKLSSICCSLWTAWRIEIRQWKDFYVKMLRALFSSPALRHQKDLSGH